MDDVKRDALQAALDEAEEEHEQLESVIKYLRGKLGIEGDKSPEVIKMPPGTLPPVVGNAASAVGESEFYGLSAPKAAREVLNRVGRARPLKTDEIFEAIKKGGVQISSSEVLYRSLFRDRIFHRVGRGRWGLRAWYPNAPVKGPSVSGAAGTATTEQNAERVDEAEAARMEPEGESAT